MLKGTTNEERIWNFLTCKGLNSFAVAGLMGNLYAESGLQPNNLQNSYERSLGMTDAEYTAAVDNGSYSNFIKDSAGYGLAQWTYWSRKQNLLNYVKKAGKSIGDLEAQLCFLYLRKPKFCGILSQENQDAALRPASGRRVELWNWNKPRSAQRSCALLSRRITAFITTRTPPSSRTLNTTPWRGN